MACTQAYRAMYTQSAFQKATTNSPCLLDKRVSIVSLQVFAAYRIFFLPPLYTHAQWRLKAESAPAQFAILPFLSPLMVHSVLLALPCRADRLRFSRSPLDGNPPKVALCVLIDPFWPSLSQQPLSTHPLPLLPYPTGVAAPLYGLYFVYLVYSLNVPS